MASTLKNDIDAGTTLTKGVQLFTMTRARRQFHVSDQGGTDRQNLIDAAGLFVDSHNTAGDGTPIHPDYEEFNDLPLAAVHVSPWGTGTSGIGVYQRTRATVPRFPAFENAVERWFRAGRKTVRYFPTETFNYTKSGVDYGDGWTVTYIPANRDYRRNEITVTTLLDKHPGPQITATLGIDDLSETYMAVNADPMTVNGFDRPRGTLRLDAINVTPINTPSRVMYETQYVFLEDPRTWFTRLLEISYAICSNITPEPTADQGCATSGSTTVIYKEHLIDEEWVNAAGNITVTPTYPIVDFEGLFPIHDQLEGYRSPGQEASSGRHGLPWAWN